MRQRLSSPLGRAWLTVAVGLALGLGSVAIVGAARPAPRWQQAPKAKTTIAPAPVAPAQPGLALPTPPQPDGVSFRGRVVDDETGEPIEFFSLQSGLSNPHDSSEVSWGRHPRAIPNSYRIVDGRAIADRNPDGEFDHYLSAPREGDDRRAWLRVVADGYEPRPVTEKPPGPAEAGKTIAVTVRLRRGRALVGRVLDHDGRPAAGATVFLIRPNGSIRMVDDVVGEGSDTGLIDPSVTRARADEQGHFRITGVGDARLLGVSSPMMHLHAEPIPTPGEELTIRLPEPATIRIPFTMEGAGPEALIWLKLKTPDDPEPTLSVTRTVAVPNGGEVILRDATPGEYTLWRSKMVPNGDHPRRTSLEHRTFAVEAGETEVVSFVREGAAPISGSTTLPFKDAVRMVFAGVEAADQPEAVGGIFPLRQWLDIVACDADGRFRTAHLPPGEYIVHAAGYQHGPRYEPFGTFNDAPNLRGSARVTVTADGPPPEVLIHLSDGRPREAASLPDGSPAALQPSRAE